MHVHFVSLHCTQRAGAENACHNSVAVDGCKLYILGISSVTVISLLSWEEVYTYILISYMTRFGSSNDFRGSIDCLKGTILKELSD